MVQEILVGIVGVIVILIVVSKIYKFFFSKDNQRRSCGCSDCHCSPAKKHVK